MAYLANSSGLVPGIEKSRLRVARNSKYADGSVFECPNDVVGDQVCLVWMAEVCKRMSRAGDSKPYALSCVAEVMYQALQSPESLSPPLISVQTSVLKDWDVFVQFDIKWSQYFDWSVEKAPARSYPVRMGQCTAFSIGWPREGTDRWMARPGGWKEGRISGKEVNHQPRRDDEEQRMDGKVKLPNEDDCSSRSAG